MLANGMLKHKNQMEECFVSLFVVLWFIQVATASMQDLCSSTVSLTLLHNALCVV